MALASQTRDGLKMFRAIGPGPNRERWPDQIGFFESRSTETLLGDGNRSSKSMTAAAWFASMARDVPIQTEDGREIHCRREHQRGRPLVLWVVGLQLNHIGQTIHRLLFQPGAYKIIQDRVTGAWRPWMPWHADDADRWSETRDSYPLIPASEVEKFSWESEADKIFLSVTLKNGTKIFAFASSGEVKMGDPVDGIWIDEKMWFDTHYPEYRMRLLDKAGCMVWSTMARPESEMWRRIKEVAGEQLEQVEKGERKAEDRHVRYFQFTTSGNPFILKHVKAQLHDSTMTHDDLALRDSGEDITGRFLCYPHYSEDLHSLEHYDDELHRAVRSNAYVPPDSWTHELSLDPHGTRPAVLLSATPPQEFWPSPDRPAHVPYQEFYAYGVDADGLARQIRDFAQMWGLTFHRFIIDGQAARQSALSFNIKVGDNYSRAFREQNLLCTETADQFIPGSPDWGARSEVINKWLSLSTVGVPQLRIVRKSCPNLCRQMATNMRVNTGKVVTNKEARQTSDMRHTLEYYASRNPKYQPRTMRGKEDHWWEEEQKRINAMFGKADTKGGAFNMGPPSLAN